MAGSAVKRVGQTGHVGYDIDAFFGGIFLKI